MAIKQGSKVLWNGAEYQVVEVSGQFLKLIREGSAKSIEVHWHLVTDLNPDPPKPRSRSSADALSVMAAMAATWGALASNSYRRNSPRRRSR